MQDFKADPDFQDIVSLWHVADFDAAIDALDDKANSYDRGGIRAVTHLGGKAGLKKYVQNKGEYNQSDELGTNFQECYERFSG